MVAKVLAKAGKDNFHPWEHPKELSWPVTQHRLVSRRAFVYWLGLGKGSASPEIPMAIGGVDSCSQDLV